MKLDYTAIGVTVAVTLVAVFVANHFGNNFLVAKDKADPKKLA